MRIDIPGYKELNITTLLLDYNGTIATDGIIPESVKSRLKELAEDFDDEDVNADDDEEEDNLFKDDFALEDFQFAFDDDESDEEEDSAYEEADESEEFDLDSMDDLADQDFAIPRRDYQVPLVFEITLEELMEMTDEY